MLAQTEASATVADERPVEIVLVHKDVDHLLNWLIGFLLVALALSFGGAAVTALSTFPLNEGWYETLIFFEKHGLKAYTDVEFVLPPMTLLYYRLYDFITHSQFAATKLLGLTLTLVNCGLLYFWLNRLFARSAVVLSVVVTFVILTTEPLYSAGDYHDLVQLFVTVAIIVALLPRLHTGRPAVTFLLAMDALLGADAQALFLTKQNVGLGIASTIALFLIARLFGSLARRRHIETRVTIARLIVYVAAYFATGLLILRVAGIHGSYFSFVTYLLTIQSKGSALYATTRLLHDSNNITLLLPGFEIAVAGVFLCLIGQYLWHVKQTERLTLSSVFGDRFPKRYFNIAKALIFVGAPIFVFKMALDAIVAQDPIFLWNFWPAIFAIAAFLIDLFFSISALFGEPTVPWLRSSRTVDFTRVLLFGAIFYWNSLTASMSVLPLIIIFSFYAALWIDVVFRFASRQPMAWLRPFLFAVSAIVVTFVVRLEMFKFQNPYEWWGMQEGPVFASSVPIDLPYMKGLRFDPERASMLHTIVHEIEANTSPADRILTYPDIPVFYMLADRLPMTRTYVQWFDFSTNASLLPDFERVSQAPPKIIVQMSIPRSVYEGHEGLLGRALPQKSFSEYLQCMVSSAAFTDLSPFYYNRSDALKGTFRLRTAHALSGSDIDQLAALIRDFSSASSVVTGALGLGDSELTLTQMQALPDQKTPEFGGIIVQGKGEDLPMLLLRLNAATQAKFLPYEDNYVVHVLKRQPSWKRKGSACQATLSRDLRTF